MATDDQFAGVVKQRSQLGLAMQRVELAAAAPAAKDTWIPELTQHLRELDTAFDQYIRDVQAPLGLMDQIVDRAPRLQRSVETSAANLASVAGMIKEAVALVGAEDASNRVDEVREATMAALVALARHRQKCADLIYDAYDIDIGGY
ncbi:MAG: hypothetical protein QNJ75_11480 [Acidimicrobiia bacterium]|nr:hypothetical protein [Acidimicrobiia bacterium]